MPWNPTSSGGNLGSERKPGAGYPIAGYRFPNPGSARCSSRCGCQGRTCGWPTTASGWWNLERLGGAEQLEAGPEPAGAPALRRCLAWWRRIRIAQWVGRVRTAAGIGPQARAAACFADSGRPGRSSCLTLESRRRAEPHRSRLPFRLTAGLWAETAGWWAVRPVASSGAGLLELDAASRREHAGRHSPAATAPPSFEPAQIRPGRSRIWFAGTRASHNPRLVLPRFCPQSQFHPVGEGPQWTDAMAHGLNLLTPVLDQPCWGVLGRQLRRLAPAFGRLTPAASTGQWAWSMWIAPPAPGSVVAAGKASARGWRWGQCGGFTVLAALCFTDLQRGACRYAWRSGRPGSRHPRFEAHYLDGLVRSVAGGEGALLSSASPLLHAIAIRLPRDLFQGLRDTCAAGSDREDGPWH